MLPSEQCSPRNTSGVFALEEEGFGLAVLESEYLAVPPDVELTLPLSGLVSRLPIQSLSLHPPPLVQRAFGVVALGEGGAGGAHLARIYLLTAEGIFIGTHDGGL